MVKCFAVASFLLVIHTHVSQSISHFLSLPSVFQELEPELICAMIHGIEHRAELHRLYDLALHTGMVPAIGSFLPEETHVLYAEKGREPRNALDLGEDSVFIHELRELLHFSFQTESNAFTVRHTGS